MTLLASGHASLLREIHPTARQLDFLAAMERTKYVLFGGAAGPGKSYILRWGLVWFLVRECFVRRGLQGVRVGMFCETYRDLEDRQIAAVRTQFPPWLGSYNEQRREFTLSSALGSGIIAFRNLDEPEKYRSVEFGAIAVDELTMNERAAFDLLRFRLRWPGLEHSPFLAATNPTGPGHSWVKKLWLDRDFSGTDATLNPDDFAFIPALPQDNDTLPASYYETLRTLPPELRAALLEGRWDIHAGQAFPDFRPRTQEGEPYHVVPYAPVPEKWRRVGGHDWGYDEPCYTLWAVHDPAGGLVVYRELWGRHWTGSEIASQVLLAQGNDQIPVYWSGSDIAAEHLARLTADQRRVLEEKGLAQHSILEQYRAAGWLTVRPVNAGATARLAGLMRLHEVLQRERPDGTPFLRIMETCPLLIRCLREIQTDPRRTNDVRTEYPADAEVRDEPYDVLRYIIMSIPDGRTGAQPREPVALVRHY